MTKAFALLACAFILGASLLFAADGDSKNAPRLAHAVKAVTDLPEYRTAHWGLYVVDLASGEVLLDQQSEKLFSPASCTKLFTVAAALDTLGQDYRFHTRLVYQGDLQEATQTLKGNIILQAAGDLTLGGRTQTDGTIAFADHDHTYANGDNRGQLTEPNPLQGLESLARAVSSRVKNWEGDLLIDDRLFDHAESTGSGPGRLTPILVNDNVLDFLITPSGNVGELAAVDHRPKSPTIVVDAHVETVEKGKKPSVSVALPGPGRYVVRGSIPVGHAPLVRIREVDNPAAHARSLLLEALGRAGVKTRTSPLSVATESLPSREGVAKLPLLAELVSPPFAENAKLILKVSHNLHASTLPLLLAAHNKQRTLNQGLRLEAERFKSLGVSEGSVSFGGGAGGARADFVTPQATVALLRHMATRSDFPVYRRALPILGVDGTLSAAVDKDSPARGKFFAKTGTLSWTNGLTGRDLLTSKALAGYGETAKGRKLAYAFFVNGVPLAEEGAVKVGKDLGKLCEMMYQAE
jgi:D-alanyl-D-alanine carboxypeptidase/D-alanyl-D-alanine-endopeptidase (penicillin-binding protein 4)